MKKIFYVIFALLLTAGLSAQQTTHSSSPVTEGEELDEQDLVNMEIYERICSEVSPLSGQPMPVLVTEIARQLLGTEYVASTLEHSPEELRVYLDKTDCILFVELCSCFALTVKGLRIVPSADKDYAPNDNPQVERATPSYRLLCDNIRCMRYREGKVNGYASRIHYTSEWLLQNATNGILTEYTRDFGEEYEQKFYFMTSHPERYEALSDPREKERISEVETMLNTHAPYYWISQERLLMPDVMAGIHTGDIVCFVSRQGQGIDIAHVAIACEVDGEMHFIHASYGSKKVKIEETSLADYAGNGIRVARFNPALDAFSSTPTIR